MAVDELVPPEMITLNVEDMLISRMKSILKEIEHEQKNEDPRFLYRVLPSIRAEDEESYNPKIISIGPFHHNSPELHEMQQLKWQFLFNLIQRSHCNSLENYIEKVRFLESKVRNCYSGEIEPDTDRFVEMLVLDGCFIIEFLLKWLLGNKDDVLGNKDDVFGSKDDYLYAVNWNIPLIRNDLLLLENQIPFFVLDSLFNESVVPELQDCSLNLTKLAHTFLTKVEDLPVPPCITDLLQLYHYTLRPTFNPQDQSSLVTCGTKIMKEVKRMVICSFYWVLSCILYCRWPQSVDDDTRAPRMIPSAVELKEAGVQFKVKKKSSCSLDITFEDGVLEMPMVSVQAATIPLFRNLVAFEQCNPKSGSYFTSYVALMDNLIDTPEDVLVLEACGILESKLGGRDEVTKFFNSLGKGGYLDYEKHYLKNVFTEVKKYSTTESHQWRAKLVHDYFGNPWSIVSLIAAVILLILAAIQTAYSVLAYVAPSSTDSSTPSSS